MKMIQTDVLLQTLTAWSQKVPLEIFTLLGAFTEEVIAPIPSPFVMTLAGSLAEAQHGTWVILLWLAVVGAFGKTVGSWIIYWLVDKAEDVVIGRFGKFFGISHKDLESVGEYFSKGGKDDLLLLVVRCIPVMPSSPVSAACGLVKVPMKTFLWTTFVGSIVRNLFFLALGFYGLQTAGSVMNGLEQVETIMKVLFILAVLATLAFLYRKRQKESPLMWVKNIFKK